MHKNWKPRENLCTILIFEQKQKNPSRSTIIFLNLLQIFKKIDVFNYLDFRFMFETLKKLVEAFTREINQFIKSLDARKNSLMLKKRWKLLFNWKKISICRSIIGIRSLLNVRCVNSCIHEFPFAAMKYKTSKLFPRRHQWSLDIFLSFCFFLFIIFTFKGVARCFVSFSFYFYGYANLSVSLLAEKYLPVRCWKNK